MTPKAKEHLTVATRAMEAAIDAAYEIGKRKGIELGVEQERERLKKALFSDDEVASIVAAADAKSMPDPQKAAMVAGSLMNMARLMLAKDRKRTFSVATVIEYFDANYRAKVSADQVRTMLKILARQDEAIRVERGIYSAGPKLEVQTSLLSGAA